MTHAPLACLATAPVSIDRVLPPICSSFVDFIDFPSSARPLITSTFMFGKGRMSESGQGGVPSAESRVPSRSNSALGTRNSALFLLADAELIDDGAIPLVVGLLEVVQQATTAADELQKSAAAVMILRVRFEVLRQVADAVRQERDLHFGRAGIRIVSLVVRYEACFLFLGRWQNPVSLA